jgi:hypothetical protein
MITIHMIAYNEEKIIGFMIENYKKYLPNCNIVLYDNESTDNTKHIALDYGCSVITYKTNNTLSDAKYLEIKNNCWKDSKTKWNIACDCDELTVITEDDIIHEEKLGSNIISFEGYSMMNNADNVDLYSMKHGFRDNGYDKQYLFNKAQIKEINYEPGCHKSKPIPENNYNIKFSDKKYKALHFKYLSPNYTICRNYLFANRLSSENKEKGWGIHYNFSDQSVVDFYNNMSKNLEKII